MTGSHLAVVCRPKLNVMATLNLLVDRRLQLLVPIIIYSGLRSETGVAWLVIAVVWLMCGSCAALVWLLRRLVFVSQGFIFGEFPPLIESNSWKFFVMAVFGRSCCIPHLLPLYLIIMGWRCVSLVQAWPMPLPHTFLVCGLTASVADVCFTLVLYALISLAHA